jgi:hypothetical protein
MTKLSVLKVLSIAALLMEMTTTGAYSSEAKGIKFKKKTTTINGVTIRPGSVTVGSTMNSQCLVSDLPVKQVLGENAYRNGSKSLRVGECKTAYKKKFKGVSLEYSISKNTCVLDLKDSNLKKTEKFQTLCKSKKNKGKFSFDKYAKDKTKDTKAKNCMKKQRGEFVDFLKGLDRAEDKVIKDYINNSGKPRKIGFKMFKTPEGFSKKGFEVHDSENLIRLDFTYETDDDDCEIMSAKELKKHFIRTILNELVARPLVVEVVDEEDEEFFDLEEDEEGEEDNACEDLDSLELATGQCIGDAGDNSSTRAIIEEAIEDVTVRKQTFNYNDLGK